MKYSDLADVVKVSEAIQKIDKQMINIQNFIDHHTEKGADGGGVDGVLGEGYWGNFSTHKDGSGHGADLCGCYVGLEVAEVISDVLHTKRGELVAWLMLKGVEV